MQTTYDTRAAAHEAAKPRAHAQRLLICEYVRSCGIDGSTCDQAELALNMSHQTCSARFSEMKGKTLVQSGEVRKTRTGSSAVVWIVSEIA